MDAGGLVEVMSMAEGAMFRLSVTGERHAPPCNAMGGCSVRGRPMWFQMAVLPGDDGKDGVRVSLRCRGRDGSPSWELWLDGSCIWSVKVFSGGRTITRGEWALDGAIDDAVRARNAWALGV